MNQYRISKDKASGIIDDPNDYNNPKYIFDLLLSVMTVSTQTTRLINELPEWSFEQILY